MKNVYFYYYIPKQVRDFVNRLIPGLIKEPIPVRVPVDREEYPRRGQY